MRNPIVREQNNTRGNLTLVAKSNGDAIRIGAGMLGDVVTPPPDSCRVSDGRLLQSHVEPVQGYEIVATNITFDQLVSGRVPPDAPVGRREDFVAIVYFEDEEGRWLPHVYHPRAGMILPTSTGGASHLGTEIRNKCGEEYRRDRKKAAVNVAQLTMKDKKGPQQTCPRTTIYYLCKVRKKPAGRNNSAK